MTIAKGNMPGRTRRRPALARADDAGDRFYPWKGESFWSVTTLLNGGLPKYAIAPWSAKVVAELVANDIAAHGEYARARAAVRRWARAGRADVIARQAAGELTSVKLTKLTDADLALRHLKGEPDRIRNAAGEIGSDVHSEAETQILRLARALGEAWSEDPAAADAAIALWPPDLQRHAAAFNDWLTDWRPIYVATEATIFNRAQAYAGTLDAIAEVFVGDLLEAIARAGDPVPAFLIGRDVDARVTGIFDYKAGRSVHAEVAMQLAAYARGEFIGLADGDTELPLPPVEFGAVLHITPNGYHLRLARIDDEIFAAFLYVREVYRYNKQLAVSCLGADLAPGRAA
jgi:hypothetical protein